jgi:hypothetical protein
MPAISNEGEDFCPDQTASRQGSTVLDDPRREAVDPRHQLLALLEAGPQQVLDRTCLVANMAM